jgi:hypothetical protein
MSLIAESHMEYIAPHEPQPHPGSAISHAHKEADFEDSLGGEVKESTIQPKICVWKCEPCRDSGTEVLNVTTY